MRPEFLAAPMVSTTMTAPRLSFALLAVWLHALPGCADPCRDDGLGQKGCPADSADASAEGTGTGTQMEESGSGEATMTAESGSADATESETGTTDEGTTSDTTDTTDTGPGSCDNGMQDGDETDVDCGGSCGPTCKDGDVCLESADCEKDNCVEGYCGDPVCNPDESNTCQGCLQQECCDEIVECFADAACKCWFDCITHNNDFDPCKDACMVGNVGTITSCANSRCNQVGDCAG